MGKANPACVVVISRSPTREQSRRRFEDAVLAGLARGGTPARVLLVPHVYYLKRGDRAAKALRGLAQPVVAVSWLHPRAARWVLAALGCPPDRVRALGFRDYPQPENCIQAIEKMVRKLSGKGRAGTSAKRAPAGHPARALAVEKLKGSQRRRWYPVIDYERCVNCRQCREFCLFGVYSLDGSGRVVATRPDECKDGCPACARLCPAGAIMFPHYEDDPQIAGAAGATPRQRGRKSAAAQVPPVKRPLPGARANAAPERAPLSTRTAPRKKAKKDELDALMDELERLDQERG